MEPVNIEFILKSDIVKDIEKVEMTIKRTGNVSDTAYKTMLDASDEAFRSMSAETQIQIKAMQDLIVEMKANEDAQEALRKKFEDGDISAEKYSKSISRLSLYYSEQKSTLSGLQTQINKEIESNKLIEGSYNQKISKLRELREAYKDLSDEELNNKEIGEAMLSQIRDLETETKKFDETLKGVQTSLSNSSSIDGMKSSLDKMEKQYSSLSVEQRKNKDIGGEQAKAIRTLKSDIEKAEAQNRSFIDSLKDAPGALGQTVSGIEATTKAAMRFIATPIGVVLAAIAAALSLLTTWFKRTGEGEEALARITGAFSQVLSSVLNVASRLGSWLYKMFTDPKAAVKELGKLLEEQIINRFNAVGKMGTAVADILTNLFDSEKRKKGIKDLASAYMELITGVDNASAKLSKTIADIEKQAEIKGKLNKIAREEIALKIESEKAESRIQKLLTKATDISTPAKERNSAVREGLALIDQTTAKEVALAKRKMDLTKESYRLEYGSLANLPLEVQRSLADIEIQYIEAQTKLEEKKRAFTEKSNTLSREITNQKTDVELFNEALKKKKEAYDRFYALMAATSKEYAKNVYKDLTASGDSYLKYINNQISELEKKRSTGNLSSTENNKLAVLYGEKSNLIGTDSPVDVLRREMDAKKRLYAQDLEAYRKYLSDKKDALDKDESEGGYQQKTVVTGELTEVEEQQKKNLDDLVNKYKTGMSKLTILQTDYNKDISVLEAARTKAQKENNTDQVNLIEDAIKGRKNAYNSALSQIGAEDSTFYEVIFGNIETFSSKSLKKAIQETKDYIEKLKAQNGGAYENLTADQQKLLNQLTKGLAKAEKSLKDKIPDDLKKASEALSQLSELVGVFDSDLGESVKTTSELAGGAADVATGIASFSTDPLGAITKIIGGVTKIVKVFKEAKESAKKAKQEIETYQFNQYIKELEINEIYRERLRTAQQIGETSLAYNKRITEELNRQSQSNNTEYNTVISKLQSMKYVSGMHTEEYGGFLGVAKKTRAVQEYSSMLGMTYEQIESLYNSGSLDEKAKSLFEQLRSLKEEGEDINQMLVDQAEAMREAYTGTTSDAITDGILQGFENGWTTAADFADDFGEMMKKAVLKSIQLQYLEPEIESWYKAFSQYNMDGTLSKHVDELRSWMNQIVETGSNMYQTAVDTLGISNDITQSEAEKNGIQSITETTANKLEGDSSAMRVNTSKIIIQLISLNETMTKQLEMTQKIADNTERLSKLDILDSIVTIITRLEQDGLKLKN